MRSIGLALFVGLLSAPAAQAEGAVQFDRDVRPILSNHCFACHGPDEATRKAGLRLDFEDTAKAALKSGAHAIVPGDTAASLLVERITTDDVDDRMPPADFEKQLSQDQVDTLVAWIEAGAEWENHWAYEQPERPVVPGIRGTDWPANPIDNFILSRLKEEGLQPSEVADKNTLLRRVTLDLTGLPPTMEELEAFLADESPDAYEKVVDRLLSSPRYGEHMARYWLDAARYADTNGYHIDNERFMWPWRDWVIQSFNKNQPFDQFTIEQLAGDLLPEPQRDQLIATGFNRNHMINFEGGAIPEEYHMQYVVDRVDTTSAVWMGLTMGCAQCHDHKYDPVSQKDFYELFAFFNTVDEVGLDGREGNAKPFIQVPSEEQEARRAAILERIARVEEEMRAPMPETDAAQDEWQTALSEKLRKRWDVLEPASSHAAGGATLTTQDDNSILASGVLAPKEKYLVTSTTDLESITALRLEALADESAPNKSPGRFDNGNFVLSEFEVEAAPLNNPDQKERIKFVSATADFSQDTFPISNTIDGKPDTGWAIDGKPEDRMAVYIPERPFGFEGGTILRVSLKHETAHAKHNIVRFRLAATGDAAAQRADLDGWYMSGPWQAESGDAAWSTAFPPEQEGQLAEPDLRAVSEDGRWLWIPQKHLADGRTQNLPGEIAATYLYRTITAKTARSMSLGLGSNDSIKVWLNGAVVHDNNAKRGLAPNQDMITIQLQAGENHLMMKLVNYGGDYGFYFRNAGEDFSEVPPNIEALLTRDESSRGAKDNRTIRDYYREKYSPDWQALKAQLAKATGEQDALEKEIPTTMVMNEMAEPRKTHIMKRGQYDQPGEEVSPATPDFLPAMPEDFPRNRLGFAQWLVSEKHPLMTRVTVNRFWERYFGTGLVRTTEDFGVQGARPSHPELLDWLAVEFREDGWDVKAMQRLIVTSTTYKQNSAVAPALAEQDPENILLARGPRFRLDGEMVRDNALAIAGLLAEKIGGPSVKPYQPPGIWEEVAYGSSFSAQKFAQDSGENLYRRSMYTFWKRQAPPPGMIIFDAPNRETCTVSRARSNTPLQALALMNDPQYVEAARKLAERMIREGGDTPESRITLGFCLATARVPEEKEQSVLLRTLDRGMEKYAADQGGAASLIGVGDSKPDEAIDPAELAAYTLVANLILNLDEVITKS